MYPLCFGTAYVKSGLLSRLYYSSMVVLIADLYATPDTLGRI